MRKSFLVLIFLFFTFSILNAKPLKTEAELQNIRNKADKIVQEELKNDYKKEYLKRKNNLEKIEGIKENIFSDGEFKFRLEDGVVTEALKTIETAHNTTVAKKFDEEGNLLTIIFFSNDENLRFYRYYDENLNLAIDINCIDGKCIQKGYYSDKKLAYIKEGKLTENLDILTNGKYTEYYKNGQMKVQGSYKEGKRDGEFKAFLKNGKSAGSVFYKDGEIIKSTLVKAMKDNASFSPVTDIYYKLEDSHTLRKVDYENGLLRIYFIYNKDGIPDGESVEYYEEGNIKSIIPFRNNMVEGLTITYYENGNIDEEVNYKNDKMNGEAKSYDENGKLNGRTIFKDNIKLEEDVYKENEILKNTFKNGELVKQDICTLNGTLKERRILNGNEMEYSTFYPNGNVKQRILTKDKIIIKEQIYARNGNIMSNSFFSDGKPVIEYFEYYPDGKLFRKISTINKMLNGDSIEYYPNGNIKEKISFVDDKMNGEDIEYYENGVVKEKSYFINDEEEGEYFFYDEKGKLIKTEVYKNGVKQ
ncbi:phosphatidylinositol-4-phosphate 5-kinase [Fusobacterium pseudoperiodonticum]|uniref:toxin-antitoxin system YwqK family antitoxin n=1 Tax=Fusobacterium pseudoperiodonticum TaxID=2663009 RepID=UPI0028EE34FB|nr:phosphatidylinositol-4-phosphate 5-kinase [Fusobacterium pseudoperiodonticum]